MNSFDRDDDIVISGISGRFPKSKNVEEFSQNLFNKVDMTEDYELGLLKFNSDLIPPRYGKLPNLEKFDANFFSIINKLADAMDPQMRTLIEHSYECIIDAGISPQLLRGSNTGVIIACSQSDSKDASVAGIKIKKQGLQLLGNSPFFLPNRISYALGLRGPSFVVDTACSSTSTALDCAYRYISSGLCDAFIVGSCTLCEAFNLFYEFSGLGVLALDGVSRPFDEKASGFVRSGAIGTILLQKKKDAKRIYANVIYSMSNNDGYKPEGQTLPSMEAQRDLMEKFYDKVQIDPCKLTFVEAHATGTFLGDFQEISAIDEVFYKDKNRSEKLIVGSVKSNMGHAESAAGFSSIAKIITAFENQKFPPNINLTKLRDDVAAFKENRIEIATDAVDLTSEYIAMNSFGIGGSNVHTLFKQNAKAKMNFGLPSDDLERVVLWSGRTEDAINSIFDDIEKRSLDAEYIALLQNSQIQTPDANSYRGYGIFINDDKAKCIQKDIQEFNGIRRPIIFVYSGMGTQWHKMGRNLMNIPLFAASIEKCHEILINNGVNLKEIIYSSNENVYDNILNSYLGIISIEIALTDVLKSLDVEADFIIGHSVGEIACSYADGCLTMKEALIVALTRAQITIKSKVESGAMAAVGMHHTEVEKILPANIDIACHNSAQSTTISGPKDEVLKFIEDLKSQKIFAREVACAEIPFHSRYIKEVGMKLQENLFKILTKPRNRSSKWITSTYAQDNDENKLCDAKYHADNLMNPVMFQEAMERLPKDAITIEISPHGFLQSILKSSLVDSVYVDLAKKSSNDGKIHLLDSIGRLFESGIDMKIAALYPAIDFPVSRSTRMISPLIKWNHSENYNFDFIGRKYLSEHFRKIISMNEEKYEFLQHHVIDGRAVIPGAFWIFIVWEAFGCMHGIPFQKLKVAFKDVEFLRATQILPKKDIIIAVMISPSTGKFEIIESDATVATGIIQRDDDLKITKFDIPENKDAIYLQLEDFYRHAKSLGYNFLEEFRTIQEARSDGGHSKILATNNWTLAIDALLQNVVVSIEGRLVVPRKLEKVSIDPILHRQIIDEKLKSIKDTQNDDEKLTIDLISSFELNTTVCGGIEVKSRSAMSINRHSEKKPIFEAYKFIPFNCDRVIDKNDAIKIFLQILNNSNPSFSYKVIEINDSQKVVSDTLSNITKQLPMDFSLKLLTSNKIEINDVEVINDKEINSFNNVDVIIKNDSVSDCIFITQIKSVLNENGVLITEEDSDVEIIDKDLKIVSRMDLENGKVLLMLKMSSQSENVSYKIIELTQNLEHWIESLKIALNSDDSVLIYSQSAEEFSGIVGFFKCLRMEYSSKSLKCFLIQDKNAPKFDINNPFYAAQIAKGHSINVYKNGQWGNYYHLNIKENHELKPQRDHCYVNYLRKGDISSLKWLQGPLNIINSSDPLVKIQYAALNFKDVIYALGYIQDNLNLRKQCSIGLEFSGIRLDTGERVMGMISSFVGGFSNYCILNNDTSYSKVPDSLTLEDAATCYIVYHTVYFAYFQSTQIEAGKSILIHSGAGGVGQAALHTAFAYGLEVFTTVGNEEKRKFLLETFPQLKPENIGNSRDTSFEQMIMTNTKGKGVDYVLNSLSGDKLKASLECLGTNGVFLEIGRADVEMGMLIDSRFLLKNISIKLIRIDLEAKNQKLFEMFYHDLSLGIIKPITRTVFDASEVESAFRFMMTGNHIGKILLKVHANENDVESVPLNVLPRFYSNENHSYVIIGGLGGLGLEFCQWLVGRECRKLVISSSRGISNQYQAFKINYLKSFDVEIVISTDDITTKSGCEELLLKALKLGPIGGIFNFAAILQDAVFENQTVEMFQKSLAPKSVATKHLHELSLKHCPVLKHFVVFSSVSSGRGNGGQTNYGMSNSIMEEIIEMRHEMNLPAKAIQWGPIKDVGMLAEIQSESIGQYTLISLSSFLESLDTVLLNSEPIVACTGPLQKLLTNLKDKSFIEVLMNLLNIDDRKSINMNSTLIQLGIDSLTGVELQQIVQRDFNISLTPNEIKTLTLSDLEKKIQLTSTSNGKDKEAAVDFLGEYFNLNDLIESTLSTELVVKLNDVESQNQKYLIIPGLLGVVTKSFYEMASNLSGSAYGLQYSYIYDKSDDIKNLDNVVNLLKPYALEFFTGCNQFVLIAHSFGVLIALKLAKILQENLNITGHLIAIDGSPEIHNQIGNSLVVGKHENEIDELIVNEVKKFLKESKRPDENSLNSEKREIEENLANTLVSKFKVARTVNENDFTELCETKITLLKASEDLVKTTSESYGLSEYSKYPVNVHHFKESHNSILTANDTYKIINELINT